MDKTLDGSNPNNRQEKRFLGTTKENIASIFQRRGETELRNTIRLVGGDHRSQKLSETMIGQVINTLRKTTPADNQKFILETVKLRQEQVTESHTGEVDMSIMSHQLIRLRHFDALFPQ